MGRVLVLVVVVSMAVGCNTSTEEPAPERPSTVMVTGPNPVIVNPPPGNSVLIIPGPTQPQAPPPQQQNPTPTQPPPPSNSPSQPNNHAATEVFVSVTSFLRNGQLIKGRAAHYQPGDVLYLTCTPKDEDHQPTKNHGPIQSWNIRSSNLGGSDFYFTDTNTFNPDIHVSPNSGSGSVEADCRVDDIKSNTLSMPIQP